MYFDAMFECCLVAFRWLLAVNRRTWSYLNRLPFPNCNSVSVVLYIVFKRFHLIFPVAHLDSQVEARFMHSLSHLAYASRIAYHPCIILFELCTWLIVFRLLVCLVWVEPGDEFANEEPVEFAFEDPVNSDNFAGKMIIPSKSLLSLLARFSLFRYAYATMPTTCLSCLPNCHVKPLTHHVLANR